MSEILILISVVSFVLIICLLNNKFKQYELLLFAQADGDDDMKIAPSDGFFAKKNADESAELSAQRFMQMKESGDIEKAHKLGENCAETLKKEVQKFCDLDNLNLKEHHYIVLYTYAVNKSTYLFTPNSIIAQTILNVFYANIEESSPKINMHISDMAAFSLYMLCERTGECDPKQIGAVYAKLCGAEEDENTIKEGAILFDDMIKKLAEVFENPDFIFA